MGVSGRFNEGKAPEAAGRPAEPGGVAGLPGLAEAVVAAVREALVVLDAGLVVRAANPAFYVTFATTPEATLGRPLGDPGGGWFDPGLVGRLGRVISEDRPIEACELERDLPGIGPRVLRLEARRIDAGDGRPPLALLAVEDITARRLAEHRAERFAAELERSNRALEEFASVASHDLQEPLRKILTFGDRLGTTCGPALGDEGRDYLERMRGAARRMQQLIDDLLGYSRVATVDRAAATVDLGRVAREVLADLESHPEAAGARVESGALPTVRGDATALRQLVQNLVANALKFHKPGEPARVRLRPLRPGERPEGPWTGFAVEDEGIGFEPKFAEKIFRVFERLHNRSSFEGTGIGLAICRKVAERHGGSIEARGEPGRGATFLVVLPEHPSAEETRR